MSRPLVKVLRLPVGFGVKEMLVLEEALLRHDPSRSNWLVQTPGPAHPVIVLGLSGKPRDLINLERWKTYDGQLEVVKRFTGGGTVVLGPDTLLASWIMRGWPAGTNPAPAAESPRADPRAIMSWSEEVYRPMVADCFGDEMAMTFHARENDYVLGDVKFGGNAQAITRGDWVHHTSFLWDWRPEHMALLSHPRKQPDYRKQRSHESFLTPLRKHAEAHHHRERGGGGAGAAEPGADNELSETLKGRFRDAMVDAAAASFDIEHVQLDEVIGSIEDALADAGLGGLRAWEEAPKSKRARTRVLQEEELLEELEMQAAMGDMPPTIK